MASPSLHISEHIACSASTAYAFMSDPLNLPQWAAGLGGSIAYSDGKWVVPSPSGPVVIEFVPTNEYGVLDHTVVLPDGQSVYNPLRVLPDGEECEVIFTLRRQPTMSDAELDQDAAAVAADLVRLKGLLESPPG